MRIRGSIFTIVLLSWLIAGCGGGSSDGSNSDDGAPVASSAVTHPLLSQNDLLDYATLLKDSAGVIMDRTGRGTGYHPGVVARYASLQWQRWQETGDDQSLQIALVNADWLAENLQCFDGIGLWPHSWPKPPYDEDPGWGSAMTNGFGAAALAQIARYSDDEAHYLDRAKCAVSAFSSDVSDGGVRTRLDRGIYWYEEVASGIRGGHLNGMMFSLGGLYVVWKSTGSNEAEKLFKAGLGGLRERLPEYDNGFTSLYDYLVDDITGQPTRAHRNYNAIHVDQLLWLYHVTGDGMFFHYANRFLSYEPIMIQNISRVTTAGIVDGQAIESLDDGEKYGGFHQESLPITFRLEFMHPAHITRLMFIVPGDLPEFPAFELRVPGDPNSANVVVNSTISQYSHDFKGNLTTIFLIDIADYQYVTDTLDVNLFEATHGDAIRLREIGVHYNDNNRLILDRFRDLKKRKQW
jgi:hypothetical protein